MIKACIFDLDGTLADTLESMAVAANDALEAAGYPALPVDNYKYYAGDGAKTLVERALKDAAAACHKDVQMAMTKDFDRIYGMYSDRFREDCTYKVTVYEGILAMLLELRHRGIKTAVLSNKPHERVLDVIGKLFGEGWFDHVLGQQETVPKKPNPAGALITAKALGVSPDECMYFGDTNVDMQTGNAAGMDTVGVLWGFRTRAELEENQAHHIAAHPQDIVALVDMKNNGMCIDTPVRLIVSDVDGTLVKSGHKYLEDGMIDTINALADKGIVFAVASGRQRQSITELFEGVKKPIYMICENGGNICYDGRDLDFHGFSEKQYRQIVRAVKAYCPDAFFAMAAPDYYYTEKNDTDFADTLAKKYFFRVKCVDNIELLQQPVCKIAVYTKTDVWTFARHFRQMWPDSMEIAVSGDRWIDFNPIGVNKGSGVRRLQEILGITASETMVFGDNENDVPMMGCAKFSCAVSNALPAAKRAAHFETGSVLNELKKVLAQSGS